MLLAFASVAGLVAIALRVEPPPETRKSNRLVTLHLLAEQRECVEFWPHCEHYLFLHAPVAQAPAPDESVGEIDFYLAVEVFDAG